MLKISTKIVSELIESAVKNGKSEQIQVSDKDMSYLRMLVSRHNKKNGTKISVRGVHGVYRELCAPQNRILDTAEWKPMFDVIQNVVADSNYIITKEQFELVQDRMNSILDLCRKRMDVEHFEIKINNLLN